MRLWARVRSPGGAHLGDVFNLKSASASKELDGAGDFTLTFSTADELAGPLLVNENQVEVYLEQDDDVRLFARGIIRDNTVSETESARDVMVLGPDSLDALTRKSVLLGRIYTNQPVETIAADLIALVPGWSVSAESGLGSQTARFDGVSVLKALIRMAEEKGLHLREGVEPYSVEIGAFGDTVGVTACNSTSPTHELNDADELLLITSIRRKTNSRDIVNWIIPQGAGEGTAALTLADSTRAGIGSLTGPDGQTLYSMSDADSITAYGQIEKIITFKEIAPVENSASAKELAANALYDAAAAWLERNATPLVTYSISCVKARAAIRPGDQIRLVYKGVVETESGEYSYLDVDDLFWVMKVSEQVNESGATMSLDLASVDRRELGAEEMIVSAVEAMDVRNVSVQTFPFGFQDSSERMIQAGSAPHYKEAVFGLKISAIFTDIQRVELRVTSRPLVSPTGMNVLFGSSDWTYYYAVYESTWYPQGVHLYINGVDVSTALGGPWNPNPANSAIDVTLNITSYITGASGGLYQDHTIVFKAEESNIQDGKVIPGSTSVSEDMSSGYIDCKILVLGTARAVLSS